VILNSALGTSEFSPNDALLIVQCGLGGRPQTDAAGSDQGEHTGYFPGGFFEYSKDRLTLRFTTSAAQPGYCAACSVE
jgi:hypothetical protein